MDTSIDNTPLIAVVGETASGKTAAAIELALKVNGEIICADSRTVYRHMTIGTAKPTAEEQSRVKHHLIDVAEPGELFSVAMFQRMAQECIQDIVSRGKVPMVVGGSGLYVDSVLYNFQFKDKPNDALRAHLLQMTDDELTTLLHTKNIDTSKLNTKNRRHVIRAIERSGEVAQNTDIRRNAIILGLQLDREVLKKRIQKRVEQMFADGFIDEVRSVAGKYGWDNEAMSGIGYKVVREYLEDKATLGEAKEAFVRRDISLAKRQRTWFKRNPDIEWFTDSAALIARGVEFNDTFNYNKA